MMYYNNDSEEEGLGGPIIDGDSEGNSGDSLGQDGNKTPNEKEKNKAEKTEEKAEKGKEAVEKGKEIAEKSKEVVEKGKKAVEKGKKVAEAIEKASKVGKFATAGPVLFWVGIIVLIIIIVVGIIGFFIFMPGLVSEKIKQFAINFVDSIQGIVESRENVIHGEEIANVANYLEQMGYDLKGEGFVTDDIEGNEEQYGNAWSDSMKVRFVNPGNTNNAGGTNNIDENSNDNIIRLIHDEKQGVYRDTDENVFAIYSDPIRTYLISDTLSSIIKNNNVSIKNMGVINILFSLGETLAGTLLSPIVGLSLVNDGLGRFSNPKYGTGLISFYHEAGDIGIRGEAYDILERGQITLDPATKKLKIQRGWTNSALTFDVDGWTGRYGMPLEFLLSIHIATQMPDLAMDIATSFDTDVEILLHEVNASQGASVQAGFHVGPGFSLDSDFITWNDIINISAVDNDVIEGFWNNWIVPLINGIGFDGDDLTLPAMSERNYYELFAGKVPHCDIGGEEFLLDLVENGKLETNECTCCSHIPHSTKYIQGEVSEECEGTGNLELSDSFNIGNHTICENCKAKVNMIIGALTNVQENNFNSYTPYISQVKNHWFRDVYFVINDVQNTDVAITDEKYFYETNERWTLYETYQEEDKENGNIPEGFEVGDYKLYEYSYDNKTGKETYTEWKKSKSEAEERNELVAGGDTSVSRLVKKSITKKLTEIVDDEGNSIVTGINGNRWIAYEIGSNSQASWSKVEVNENTPNDIKYFKDYIYYKENRPGDIKQIEDGQRGATNPKIKDMFINNKYYQYDGTVAKADKIIEDRNKHKNDYRKILSYNTKEGEIVTAEIKSDNYVLGQDFNTSYETFISEGDPRDESLLGKVSISKDSLTAFAMLENTHTLDADYIYKDFKELIVELNYFDKEDLSDRISEVMTWPLPETGFAGWPVRKYEKSEVYYGTLINSKEDLTLLRNADIEQAEKSLGEMNPEYTEQNPSQIATQPSVGESPNISMEEYIDIAEEVHSYMDKSHFDSGEGWDYCVFVGLGNENSFGNSCKDSNGDGVHYCGLATTIQEAMDPASKLTGGYKSCCCATYVSWALIEAGYEELKTYPGKNSAQGMYDWCKEKGFTEITDYNQIEAGDIIFGWGEPFGHTLIRGKDGLDLDGGIGLNKDPYDPKSYNEEANFVIAMRPNLSGSVQPFEGYNPGEPVVAPITGKVTEYGTVKRENTETGKEEEVEFIKIQAMDNYIFDTGSKFVAGRPGKGFTECKSSKVEDSFEKKASQEAKLREGYDYFYDEYTGVISGFVLYIEGFDLTLFDSKANGDETDGAKVLVESGNIDSEEVTRYTKNTVYNMVDDLEEARSIWKEDAKASALPLVEINGELYIKEGTVIGKTYEDSEETISEDLEQDSSEEDNATVSHIGNGNYIRLILRNLEDSIVENVESYLPKEVAKTKTIGTQASEYFLAWHLNGFGQMAIPAFPYYYTNYGDPDVDGGPGVEYTNNDNGDVPNLMPELAMIAGSNKVKHLEELGYDASKLTSLAYVGKQGNNPVKIEDVIDTYFLYINEGTDEILKRVNKNLEQHQLDALIESYIWGPGCTYLLIDKLNSTGSLTETDFEQAIIKYYPRDYGNRGRAASRLFNSDTSKYPHGYFSDADDTYYLEFKTDTPFSELVYENKKVPDVMDTVNN